MQKIKDRSAIGLIDGMIPTFKDVALVEDFVFVEDVLQVQRLLRAQDFQQAAPAGL